MGTPELRQRTAAPTHAHGGQVVTTLTMAILMVASCNVIAASGCNYMKMDNPPDVDKVDQFVDQSTCAYATAANILAAAGYGGAGGVEDRAKRIYGHMTEYYCWAEYLGEELPCVSHHTSSLLRWWLNDSGKNNSPSNPYTRITFRGYVGQQKKWTHENGPRFVGNLLRSCDFVGISLVPDGGGLGHAITAWGDDVPSKAALTNDDPTTLIVSDSDEDHSGDTQKYLYQPFQSTIQNTAATMVIPGDGVPGWSINYGGADWVIRSIATLSESQYPIDGVIPIYAVSSYEISQTCTSDAVGLFYEIGVSDTASDCATEICRILSWEVGSDIAGATYDVTPIPESDTGGAPRRLRVHWSFPNHKVAPGDIVTVTTVLSLKSTLNVVHEAPSWRCETEGSYEAAPSLEWSMQTPAQGPFRPSDSPVGGHVIGSLLVVEAAEPDVEAPVARFRFLAEYPYTANPTSHVVSFIGADPSLALAEASFGHSYGYLESDQLWTFESWDAGPLSSVNPLDGGIVYPTLDWPHLLPYPKGEDYIRPGISATTPPVGLVATPIP